MSSNTTTPSPTPTTTPALTPTTYSPTTYQLPTLTSWGTPPDGNPYFNLADRILQLMTSGSSGERMMRGFLMGVGIGIILGGALCCWVPCFGRRRRGSRERRARRRRHGRYYFAEPRARRRRSAGAGSAAGHGQTSETPPVSVWEGSRARTWTGWDRFRRRRWALMDGDGGT